MEAQTANLAIKALVCLPGNAGAVNNCGQLQPHIPNCCSRHCPAHAKFACAGFCSWGCIPGFWQQPPLSSKPGSGHGQTFVHRGMWRGRNSWNFNEGRDKWCIYLRESWLYISASLQSCSQQWLCCRRAQLCPHASQFCSLGIAVTAWNALHHGSSKAPWTFYMKETLMWLLKRTKGILWIFGFAQVLYIYISWYYCRAGETFPAVPWQPWPWQVPRSWPVAPEWPSAPHWPCTELHSPPHNINSDWSMKINNFPVAEWTQISDAGSSNQVKVDPLEFCEHEGRHQPFFCRVTQP